MAVTVLDFEGGTPGAAVAGDATSGFSSVVVDGGQSMVYTSTAGQFQHGSRGIAITAVTASAHGYGQIIGLNTPQMAIDGLFKWPSVSTADFYQLRLMSVTGVAIASVLVNSAGKIRLQGNGGATIFTLTAATPTNAWVRLKLWVDPGTSSSTGSAKLEVWNADTSTNIAGTTYSTTTADFGTANIDQIRAGNGGGYASTYFMDLIAYDPSATTLMPDQGGNTPPTISTIVGNQNLAAGVTASLTATASDSDGTIASQAWTGTRWTTTAAPASITGSLTGASTAAATYTTAAAPSLDIATFLVTDNSGATATASTEVRVPGTGEVKVLAGWGGAGVTVTNVGSAASEGATLGTGTVGSPDDTKYVEFPAATGTAQARRWRLAPTVALTSGTLTHRLGLSAAGTVGVNVRLYQGATVKASWAVTGVSTTVTDYTTTLTPTQAGSITDWGNLWIEYEEV